ncbi:MAG: 1,4-alpha-glucan branching enzyme GlgB [Alphaproteobacteria bacterium]|nr:MAG: 1,4-alpha-glucan branching enzyme GlgB [Alphaproteobacteria bacterium]
MTQIAIDSADFEIIAGDAVSGRLSDPFAFLGPHRVGAGTMLRAFLPGARAVEARARDDGGLLGELAETSFTGLFIGELREMRPYLLRITWPEAVQETEDPYSFGFILGDLDLHLFAEGSHWHLAERMGAQPREIDGVSGVAFSVWAPNARRVAVVGDFNSWDGRRHPMRLRHGAGVWELFVPRIGSGERYKFEIIGYHGELLPQKADPLARAAERPPATASIVAAPDLLRWTDGAWMAERGRRQTREAPIAIYEMHAGSWLRPRDDPRGVFDWDGLAKKLIPYVLDMGFTHVELLPVMGHPFAGSWGYQPLSLFAPAAQLGEPAGLARFVNACHEAELGVILDWVPGHFPNDAHGMVRFDGTALYEHQDPREGLHRDWDTLIYNYGRREVQGFLIASALHWLEHFHMDGLRVDAVASMLYRNYSRGPGEWVPNRFGGPENLEAIDFLRRMNDIVAERQPGAITIAEESTAWPGVSASTRDGGLGFSYKWNMGWMHDTLHYMSREPIHRAWHHHDITFGLHYAFSERFVLPLSHDEVVHGKRSLIGRMPGDQWQRFANLRAYFAFMWGHPGKKLLFMGGEIAQEREWNHEGEIDWFLLERPEHAGIQRLVRDLNRLYGTERALHAADSEPQGFQWVIGDDSANSVFAFLRLGEGGRPILCVFNMTPVPRQAYRIGVPEPGFWRELLNTDAAIYGGSNMGNGGGVDAAGGPAHGRAQSLELTLPPLSALYLGGGA